MTTLQASSEDDSILSQAFTRDRSADPAADTTPAPAPEQTAEPAAEAATPDTVPPDQSGEVVQGRDPKNGRFVPVGELVSERNKFKERLDHEARLREEAERRAAQYEQMVARFQQPSQAQQQQFQQPVQTPPPDFYENPAGFVEHLQGQFAQQLTAFQQNMQLVQMDQRAEISENFNRQRHGDETVDKAIALLDAEARRNPQQGKGYYQHFLQQRDPFGSLVDWYKKNAALAEFGADPQSYRDKIKQEVLAELKGGQSPTGARPAAAAPAQTRFPTSLADATASGRGQSALVTDEAIMSKAFGRG